MPRKTKIGHTGTLDPLASGLLVLVIGRATRLSRYVTGLDKTYTATARFGAISDSLDADGNITELNTPMPTEAAIQAATPQFTGDIQQTPPMASAIKIGGERLYAMHRRGETVERQARPVTIHSLELTHLDVTPNSATFDIHCTSGTYVRSLISDLADSLDSGAYLTDLRRNSVGHLTLEAATTPQTLTPDYLKNHIIHTKRLVEHLPVLEASEDLERDVLSGRGIQAEGFTGSFRVEKGDRLLGIYTADGVVGRAEVVLCAG